MARKAHIFKILPEHFEKVRTGEKKAEFRRADDRVFNINDVVLLREIEPSIGFSSNTMEPFCRGTKYTGRALICDITDITMVNSVYPELKELPDFVMLSISVTHFSEETISW